MGIIKNWIMLTVILIMFGGCDFNKSESIEEVNISGHSVVVEGCNIILNASAKFDSGRTKTISPSWSIIKEDGDGTIDGDGRVKGIKKGTITAKAEKDGKSTTFRIVVSENQNTLTFTDMEKYYNVVFDYTKGTSPLEMGEMMGQAIKSAEPKYEQYIESYLVNVMRDISGGRPLNDVYDMFLKRVRDIRPTMAQEYRDEIDGIAQQMSGGSRNEIGDMKLSLDEMYIYNLLGDIYRASQCSVISVFGEKSATGHTITGRNLDWTDPRDQWAKVQALLTIKTKEKSIMTIGFLGYQAVITGLSQDKIFSAILDSEAVDKYYSKDKRSYFFDLRTALMTKKTLDEIAQYMGDPSKAYAFNHLVFLSDPDESKVLENNFSGRGTNMRRSLRSWNSELNDGLTWDEPYSVGAVNAFLLKGNYDNLTGVRVNENRWRCLKKQMSLHSGKLTVDELTAVTICNNGDGLGGMDRGDLYNNMTIQTVIIEPDTLKMKIAFKPKYGGITETPTFTEIPEVFK